MSPSIARRARRPATVTLASFAVHVAALSIVEPGSRAMVDSELNEVDVTLIVTPAPPKPEPAEPATDASAPDVQSDAPAPPKPRRTPATPDAPDPGDISPPVSQQTPPKSFDPTDAARAFVLSQQSISDERFKVDQGAPRSRALSPGEFFEGVGGKHYLTEREPPRLRPNKDGSYRYRGHVFEATVAENGTVTFNDGHKVFNGKGGIGLRFDLTSRYLRKHGEDPNRAEKRWFLESTAEFREELAQRWRAKHLRLALQKLRGRLVLIWEDGLLTDGEKAARVISIFRDTANDEAGEAARAAIAEFVKKRMPHIELPPTSNGSKD